jgi:hypothetical protein
MDDSKGRVEGQIDEWRAVCATLRDCGFHLIKQSNVGFVGRALEDQHSDALALLARTMSNLSGAILLLDNHQIVEARVITRCCIENFFWVGGVINQGDGFVRRIRRDGFHQLKTIDQFFHQHKLMDHSELDESGKDFAQALHKQKYKNTAFSIKEVADGKWYSVFSMISIDSAHSSLIALRRYFSGPTPNDLTFDPEPIVDLEKIREAYYYLAFAGVGICIGVNQLFGGTIGGEHLKKLTAHYFGVVERQPECAVPTGDQPD